MCFFPCKEISKKLSARSREFNFKCDSASIRKSLIEKVIKKDIKLFLLHPETMKKYLDEKSIKNTKTEEEFDNIGTKIEKKNEEINRLLELYSLNSLDLTPIFGPVLLVVIGRLKKKHLRFLKSIFFLLLIKYRLNRYFIGGYQNDKQADNIDCRSHR